MSAGQLAGHASDSLRVAVKPTCNDNLFKRRHRGFALYDCLEIIPDVSHTVSHTTTMSADLAPNRIGSLNFCPVCGTLLDVPGDDDYVTCEQCGHTENAARASTLSALDCFSANASNVFPRRIRERPHHYAIPSRSFSLTSERQEKSCAVGTKSCG